MAKCRHRNTQIIAQDGALGVYCTLCGRMWWESYGQMTIDGILVERKRPVWVADALLKHAARQRLSASSTAGKQLADQQRGTGGAP